MDLTLDRIDLDHTSRMLVEYLHATLAAEPPEADAETQAPHELSERARVHDEWERQVAAVRLLLGARLVNACIDQYPANEVHHRD